MNTNTNTSNRTYDMVVTALLTALTYLFTRFINIQPPMALNGGGLIHLGNVMIVISAIVFGKKKAAVSAALGMALFDLTSSYFVWAPFTFVIRGAMGYALGYISHLKSRGTNTLLNVVAVLVSGAIMVVGYYIAQVILYGNWLVPMASVPGDLIQVGVALFIGLPLATVVRKAARLRVSE